MPKNIQAGFLALTIIIILAATKFLLYKLSGSLAVLSEAWHSFSDIATTLLVLIAIIRQHWRGKKEQAQADGDVDSAEGECLPEQTFWGKRAYRWVSQINTELKVSLVIAFVLLFASLSILKQVIFYTPVDLQAPVVTGLVFIGLSFLSFFLYKFEENVGEETESAALMADGQHNRADMVITLMTGASLLLYDYGLDVDRWLGLFISFYIFSFSLELLVNTVKSIHQKRTQVVMEHGFSSIILEVFQAETYRKLYQFICCLLQVGEKSAGVMQAAPKVISVTSRWGIRGVIAALLLGWLSTALYTVKSDEQALLLRFGRIVNQHEAIQPGLHWKLPRPFDRVERFQTGKVGSLTVGNLSSDKAMIWSTDHGDDQMFISGDNNLFLPYVVVHYRISNIYDYYLVHRHDDIRQLISSTTYHFLNKIFSTSSFYDLMIYRRSEWVNALKALLQKNHNNLKSGIEITDVLLKDMHPPIDLASGYEDVVAAEQQRETYLNDAKQKETQTLSGERINALKTKMDALSYVVEKRSSMQGQMANYLMRYQAYQANPEVMKEMLELQSAAKTLKEKKLYLVDPQSGISKKSLYLEKYLFGRKGQ